DAGRPAFDHCASVFRAGIIIDDVTRRGKRPSPIRGRRRIVGGVAAVKPIMTIVARLLLRRA
ncbi:MAG TPA: hypothetical protein VHI75_13870, partial [Casimicrobiaceae bacterium]|nr:hypothetical protein [Casimicrobiaceae bacterium]